MALPQTSADLVEIVIVNYHAGTSLSDCVQSILAAGENRVWVVDNASTDDSIAQLYASCGAAMADGRVHLLRQSHNLGFAKGCNLGASRTTAPYVLFLNPDALVTPETIPALVAAAHMHPQSGIIGGMLCNLDGTEQQGSRRAVLHPLAVWRTALGLARWLGQDTNQHQAPAPEIPTCVDAVSGACTMVRRSAAEQVGWWDEGYFLHCEDLDWCMRMRRGGWEVCYAPQARIYHHKGGCSRHCSARVTYYKHRGMLRLYQLWFAPQDGWMCRVVVPCAILVRGAVLWALATLRAWSARV